MSTHLSRLAHEITDRFKSKPEATQQWLLADLKRLCHVAQVDVHDRDLPETIFDLLMKMKQKQMLALPLMPAVDFASYSTCSTADLCHPRYNEIASMLNLAPLFNRKYWEWTVIVHKLAKNNMLLSGKKGVGFGIGLEPLPALFAKFGVFVLATDSPIDAISGNPWAGTDQHSIKLENLRRDDIVDAEQFHRQVEFLPCDMNNIPDTVSGFDFVWSSCCLEHLGSLRAGMDFVVDSVERCLKPGGFSVHTTEFNLASNEETVFDGPTVLYRQRDMLELVCRLRARGHEVCDFVVAPDSFFLDLHVDLPPYGSNPHMRLQIEEHVTTSAVLVVRKAYS